MLSLFAGLGVGLSLIVAIGAQNVFVLRQGIRREHVLAVVMICAMSDAVLIAVGVAGFGALLEALPWLITAARWLGAAFLLGYGLLAARRAWRGEGTGLDVQEQEDAASGVRTITRTRRGSLTTVSLTALALTWLNPHVYLDTLLLLGSVAATHGSGAAGEGRWLFGAGAVLASILWFASLGFGARFLGRWLRTPRAWRILDAGIAAVMIVLAVGLVLPALAS